MLDVFLVGRCRCRYRHLAEIFCEAVLASVFLCVSGTLKTMLMGSVALVSHHRDPSVLEVSVQVDPRLVGHRFSFPGH